MTKYCMNTKFPREPVENTWVWYVHVSSCTTAVSFVLKASRPHCWNIVIWSGRIAFKGDWSHNVSIITASNVVIDFISCHFVLLEAWEQIKWYTFLLFVMLETIVTIFRVRINQCNPEFVEKASIKEQLRNPNICFIPSSSNYCPCSCPFTFEGTEPVLV